MSIQDQILLLQKILQDFINDFHVSKLGLCRWVKWPITVIQTLEKLTQDYHLTPGVEKPVQTTLWDSTKEMCTHDHVLIYNGQSTKII